MLTDLLHQAPPEASGQVALDRFYQQQLEIYRHDHPDFPGNLHDTDHDQLNVLFVAACHGTSLADVLVKERQVYQQLLEVVQAMPEEVLAAPNQPGGQSLLQILPNQCYNHYRMHLPAIQQGLRR